MGDGHRPVEGRKRGFEEDDDTVSPSRRNPHSQLPSSKRSKHLSSPRKRPDSHGDYERRRDLHGDHRSPRRRNDSRPEDDSFSKRRDFRGSHQSPRRRDPHREEESPSRTRHFYDGALSPDADAFSRRRAHEKHSTFQRRSHNDRDGRFSFEEHDQHGNLRNAPEDTGGSRFENRERRSDHRDGELPKLYSVYRAKVQSVRPFGLFVSLEGFYKQGLVHVSQLSNNEVTNRDDPDEVKVQAIAAVAEEGDRVWVKVISLREDDGNVKIGCSLKFVSQSSGEDLDPNNVKLEQQQSRGSRQEPRKMTLDAIYNVTCSRCGGHGHLKTECYSTDKKPYELLPDIDNQVKEQPGPLTQDFNILREAAGTPGLGRGRAMVLPAWMTQGIGANLGQVPASGPRKEDSGLPDKVTTVEEALAVIALVKREKKHRRKRHSKHRKDGNGNASKEERKKRKKRGEKSSKHREGKHRSVEGAKKASKDERNQSKERLKDCNLVG